MTDSAKNRIEGEADKLKGDAKIGMADAQDKAGSFFDDAKNKIDQHQSEVDADADAARDKSEGAVDDAKDKAGSFFDDMKDKVEDMVKKVTDK